MTLKWLFFLKNRRIVQWLEASSPGPHLSNLAVSNCSKNIQNVIQMALKWLRFSEKSQKLPSVWGLRHQAPIGVNCYLARNLHNQQLSKSELQGFGINKCCNDATITAKPCLTITALTTIRYWLLFEKFKPFPLKISGCAPGCIHFTY